MSMTFFPHHMATMTEYGLGIEFKAPKHLTTVV